MQVYWCTIDASARCVCADTHSFRPRISNDTLSHGNRLGTYIANVHYTARRLPLDVVPPRDTCVIVISQFSCFHTSRRMTARIVWRGLRDNLRDASTALGERHRARGKYASKVPASLPSILRIRCYVLCGNMCGRSTG